MLNKFTKIRSLLQSKIMSFFLAMGIPLTTITTTTSCTGSCGSCQLNCAPSLFVLVLLIFKAIIHKISGKNNEVDNS